MIRRLHILCLALLALTSVLAAETPAEAAHQYTTAHQAKLTQEFREFLSIPNVAADRANLRRNADRLIEMLRSRSVESRLLSIPGAPPVVYGQISVPGAQHTIVFYAHYDGQPVTPSEWEGGSPFTPAIREVDGEPRIYARSAGDDKAAIFARLTALGKLASQAGGANPSRTKQQGVDTARTCPAGWLQRQRVDPLFRIRRKGAAD